MIFVFGLLAAACAAADPDVAPETALAGPESDDSVTAEPPPPATLGFDPDGVLLQSSDLPGWALQQPRALEGHETVAVTDCPELDIAWEAMGASGTEVRADGPTGWLRNTLIEFETATGAERLVAAAQAVEAACDTVTIGEPDDSVDEGEDDAGEQGEPAEADDLVVEPLEVTAPNNWQTGGFALRGADGELWAMAFWQRGGTIVLLETFATDAGTLAASLGDVMFARLDGSPRPLGEIVEPVPTPMPTATPAASPEIVLEFPTPVAEPTAPAEIVLAFPTATPVPPFVVALPTPAGG